MARNKYPEETIQKILEVSYQLFSQKGYEKTSIQDIVEQLGMSKGAIYHHFKSKEEILNQICENCYNCIDWFTNLCKDKSCSALEKLRRIFTMQLGDKDKQKVDILAATLFRNPKVVYDELQATISQVAPLLVQVIEDGNRDGSLQVKQPQEAAEVIMLLVNFWINPILFPVDKQHFMKKLCFYQELTNSIGIPLVDDDLFTICSDYYDAVCSAAKE